MTSPTPPRSGSPKTSRSRRRHRRDPRPLAAGFARYQTAPAAAVSAPAGADLAVFVEAWDDVAGPDRPASIPVRLARSGILSVACADAGLAQKLAFRALELTEALGAATGTPLRGLRFVVADHAIPPPTKAPVRRPVTVGRAARTAAKGLASGVEDPDLRAALEQAAAVSIQRSWDTK